MSDTSPTEPPEFGRRADQPQEPIVPKTASEALQPQAAPPPPPRSRRSRGSRSQLVVFLNFLMTIVVVAVIGAFVALYIGRRDFDGPGPTTAATTFLVKPGQGTGQIAAGLEDAGIVSDAVIFQLGYRAYGGPETMKAGEYEITPGMSMRQVMQLLQSGKSIMYSLTIPEGLTVVQAFKRIADEQALSGKMPATLPPEGSLAADTQRFTRGEDRTKVVTQMQAQQKALIDEVWAKRSPDLQLADVNEFVTLASIVEKETGVNDERPRVAAVFLNRLQKKMRLQSDPTIIYGIFGGAGKPADRPIYQSDIEKPTPYNTYVIRGLPPTPIANPGRAALEAVANPAKTDDLYFVADGSGGHVFAKTLDEHNKNVTRWRELQKQQTDGAATGESTTPQ